MKFFATTALASIAAAMTMVDPITDSDLKVSVEYSVMDGDLDVKMTMTPTGGVGNTNMLNTILIISTSRMLTE